MEEAPFGSCPECGASEYRNIRKTHLFFCDEHRLVWMAGRGLFSSWHEEVEKDWRANWEKLRDYRTIDGFGEHTPGAPLGDQTTFEDLIR